MLSDNIRNNRKRLNLSQDELAEKLGVSRQSVSFWENGQTQPTIDNIIALAKVFNISSDMLLGNVEHIQSPQDYSPELPAPRKKGKAGLIAAVTLAAVAVAAVMLLVLPAKEPSPHPDEPENGPVLQEGDFDLFTYCKNFAIEKGELNGDYCIYQQSSAKYGGVENEYFSISYWSDSDMVEFCLHCPLSDTQSHNFYLRMRGGYDGKYEYLSSKYYRDTGVPFRNAVGCIDPSVFSYSYPISCDQYDGSSDGQTEFMEQTRIGICDLIFLLKNFVAAEGMACDFSAFGFVNF